MDPHESSAAAESAIRALIARYCRLVDTGRFEAIGSYFGVLRVRGAEHEGPQAVSRFLATARRGRHLTTDVELDIDVAVDSATAVSSFVFLAPGADARWNPAVIGRYHDRFEKRAGRWCFALRDIEIEWADQAAPAPSTLVEVRSEEPR